MKSFATRCSSHCQPKSIELKSYKSSRKTKQNKNHTITISTSHRMPSVAIETIFFQMKLSSAMPINPMKSYGTISTPMKKPERFAPFLDGSARLLFWLLPPYSSISSSRVKPNSSSMLSKTNIKTPDYPPYSSLLHY